MGERDGNEKGIDTTKEVKMRDLKVRLGCMS